MSRSRVITDHDEIREWAEERGGKPSTVKGTKRGKGDAGMIRIDFPGYSGEGKLEPISWDKWFEKFDEAKLGMILQDKTRGGQQSNFNKLVSREGAAESKDTTSKRRASTRNTSQAKAKRATGARKSAARGARTGGRKGAAPTGARKGAPKKAKSRTRQR